MLQRGQDVRGVIEALEKADETDIWLPVQGSKRPRSERVHTLMSIKVRT